jgi:hypothetical protein
VAARASRASNLLVSIRALFLVLVACDQGVPAVTSDHAEIPVRDDAATRSADAFDASPVDAGVIDAAPDAALLGKGFELPANHSDTSNCIRFAIGDAREQATLCDGFGGGIWRLTNQAVRVKRGGKRTAVLDVVTKIEGFDTGLTMLEARLIVAADGMSATVTLVAPGREGANLHGHPRTYGPIERCSGPPPTATEEREERTMYGRPTFGEARRQLCDAIGTYRWNGDRFTLVK